MIEIDRNLDDAAIKRAAFVKYDTWNVACRDMSLGFFDRLKAVRGEIDTLTRPRDPFLLPDMRIAAERVKRALDNGENIAVYGDYDADGVTALAIVAGYLRRNGGACVCYIPSRFKEGYGVHRESARRLLDDGAALLITVDAGVNAFEAALDVKSLGADMIITDHHECRETLPDALAVVNPKRADSGYEFQGLCGAGVALKLIMAVETLRGGDADAVFGEYCDLAAIGTIADSVPLRDENRLIAAAGVKSIGLRPRVGIAALLTAAGIADRAVTAQTVAYTLAPAINAAGRLRSASAAAKLLLCDDKFTASDLAYRLLDYNNSRRKIEARILAEAEREIRADEPAIVLSHADWHQGIIGIVCSKLLEKYRKPVFLVAGEHGSARAEKGFPSLFALLGEAGDLLDTYGGHERAAGFSVSERNFEAFRAFILEKLRDTKTPARELDCDCLAAADELNLANAIALAKLGPWGNGSPEPVFVLENAVIRRVTPLSGGKHVRLEMEHGGANLSAVGFGFTPDGLFENSLINAAFALGINSFRGNVNPQLELRDIFVHDK